MVQQKAVSTNGITEGVIWKQLLIFFFPILFGTLFQQLYNTADAIIVGRFVGKEALGAVGGALLAANSCKMRTLVRKGQEEVKQRLDEMMDEKLKDMENGGGVFSSGSSENLDDSQSGKGEGSDKQEKDSQGRDGAERKEHGK